MLVSLKASNSDNIRIHNNGMNTGVFCPELELSDMYSPAFCEQIEGQIPPNLWIKNLSSYLAFIYVF